MSSPDVVSGRPPARSLTLLLWCAAASLGVLFIKANSLLDFATIRPRAPLTVGADYTAYVPLAALALALVLWRLFPRRSWPWLLLAGAVCALPLTLLELAPDLYARWMGEPLAIVTGCAPGFTLVGILGAATVVWQAGRRGVGAALIGTALVIQLVGPVVLGSTIRVDSGFFLASGTSFRVVSLVLVAVAVIGGLVAVIVTATGQTLGATTPTWRVTIAGGLAAASPALAFLWHPNPTRAVLDPESAVNYYLYIGLAFLAIGLAAGAAAGPRALLTSAAAGLMLGTFGMLIAPSVEVLREMSAIAVIAAAGSVIAGFGAALSRWRTQLGVGGLAMVVLGLIVLSALFNSDSPYKSYESFTLGATPVLLVIGIVAAVAAISSIGSVLAEHAETPAALVGLTTAFSLGAITIIAYFGLNAPEDKAPIAGVLPPAAGGLLIAAILIVIVAGQRRGTGPPSPPSPDQPVTDDRDSRGMMTARPG